MVLVNHGFYWGRNYQGSALGELLVRVAHAGWLGVHLFFVLSGFLITGILLDSRHTPHYYRAFYARRALRILPPYFALLLILLLLGAIQARFALFSIFFSANLAPIFGVGMQYRPLWSLGVEEHFYLLWPAAVRRLSPRALGAIAVTVALLSPLARWVAYREGAIGGLGIYTWYNLDGLALGALLAVLTRLAGSTRRTLRVLSICAIGLGASILLSGMPYGILKSRYPLGAALQFAPWCLIFAGVLALLVAASGSPWTRWARTRTLVFFGEISYGLYLIHWLGFTMYDRIVTAITGVNPAMVQGLAPAAERFMIAGSVCVAVATLSRRTFEARFFRLKDRLAPRRPSSVTDAVR